MAHAGGRQNMNNTRSTHPIILATAALAALVFQPLAARAELLAISDMFVFGDSLSDGGNSGLLTQGAGFLFPPTPYAGGRFSNGPTAVEYLWNQFNADGGLRPSRAGGTNFALGGATTGTENFNATDDSSVPDSLAFLRPAYAGLGAASQLGEFQAYATTNGFDPATSLFVVWLFPNDVFYRSSTGSLPGIVPGSPGGADDNDVVGNGIANILTTIHILAEAGAQHFLVANMANLANTPSFAGSGPLSELSIAFNTNLELALLGSEIDAEITLFDTDALFQRILADPAAVGLTNTTEACVQHLAPDDPNPCNPSEWLFWDGVHPTTRAHQILAREMRLALIAEPGTLALLGLGLVLLGLIHRRGRR
jgi:phospholipase/lecithinase/hemolysin